MRAKSWRDAVSVVVFLGAAYGCGGDDAGQGSTVDAGSDGTTGADGMADVTGNDRAIDGAAESGTDATAEGAADAANESASDDASDGGGCQVDSDCIPAGFICGLVTPGVCSPCATDQDCKNDSDYGGKGLSLCSLPQGTCQVPTCSVADGLPCPQNPADVCCSQACNTGTCCTNSQCSGATPACEKHKCVACDPVANDVYYVDPVNGSDALDGSGQSGGKLAPGCAFQTLTHAFAVLGSPAPGTIVYVLGPSVVSAGETFPLRVPQNTRITNQGNLVTVQVPATVAASDGGTQPGVGFDVSAAGVRLDGLTIDGQSNGSAHAVRVAAGGSASLSLLTAKNFSAGAAIHVEGAGSVAIGCGLFATDNQRGLHVTEQGHAVVSCVNATVLFNRNKGEGILVDGHGVLTLSGVAQSGGGGSVQASGNGTGLAMSGDWTGGQPAVSTVDGLAAWQNATGASLLGGSMVTVRRSQFLGGTIGVDIEPAPTATAWQSSTIGIDLGTTAGDAGATVGANTFQQPAGDGGVSPRNTGVGLCYGVSAAAGQTLDAAGDIWSNAAGTSSLDCAATGGALSKTIGACTGGADLGGAGIVSGTNVVVTASCN